MSDGGPDPLAISITLSGLSKLFGGDLAGVLAFARDAEAAGIDQIVVPDHLAIGENTRAYPYGIFPFSNTEPWLEPTTTLAAMAGATERIRLGTGVLIAPLRPPLLLAKTLATLDVLSRGRVDVGIGLGWQREEFEASGVPFAGRAGRLDDTLGACRALWAESPASFESETVRFEQLWCEPRPYSAGGPPLWFGIPPTDRNVVRISEYGAGWMPLSENGSELREGIARLRDGFSAAGRDPARLGVRANVPVVRSAGRGPDLDATLAQLPALREAGVSVAAFALARFARAPAEIKPFLEALAKGVAALREDSRC